MKKTFVILLAAVLLIGAGAVLANGFDQYGYNLAARIFNGTGLSWCQGKFGWSKAQCESYLGPYTYDKLVMKWNAEWDRGNDENWANPPYAAWENNEWNGNTKGGSGAVWHYKIKWDEGCAISGTPSMDGAYCIWGQFAVLMDQGKDPSMGPGHIWLAHGIPTGYGIH